MSTEQEFRSLWKEVLAETPEQCRPCHRPELSSYYLARRVEEDESFTLDDAKAEQAAEFEENCRLGAAAVDGCFGGIDCRYMVACEMPSRPRAIDIDTIL